MADNQEYLRSNGNFPKRSLEWMTRRSIAFVAATSGKGKPMSYGHGAKDKKDKS